MTAQELIDHISRMTDAEFYDWALKYGIIKPDKGWEEQKFEEFWNVFPRKTPSKRMLRASNLTAKSADLAFALFKREIRSSEEADRAIRGLKLELINRQKTNGLEYINNIQTYIRNKNWEMYLDTDEEITDVDLDMEEGSSFEFL